jgi:molybdenum cofactor cytidylyltransferase
MISAIILAAGESKRMGRPKLLLLAGGQAIIEKVVYNFLHSNVDEVIVVLGHHWKEVASLIKDKPIKVVINNDYVKGMSSSITKGLSSLNPETDAFFIVLGDQPLIEKDLINTIIKSFEENNKGIIVPTFQGEKGHPVLFSAKYKNEFSILTGDEGGKRIISLHKEDILEVEIDTDAILIDMDEEKDYQYIKNFFNYKA